MPSSIYKVSGPRRTAEKFTSGCVMKSKVWSLHEETFYHLKLISFVQQEKLIMASK